MLVYTCGPRGEEERLRVEGPAPVVVAGDHHLVLTARLQRVEHVAARLQRRRRGPRAEDLREESVQTLEKLTESGLRELASSTSRNPPSLSIESHLLMPVYVVKLISTGIG